MYHCGTKPVIAHIANGMYGAIIVDPATPLPKADREYVLVGVRVLPQRRRALKEPASFDMNKAHTMMPDWVTFNGYAGQYVDPPADRRPERASSASTWSRRARASTSTSTSSGRSSTRVYPFGDMTPRTALHGVQTFPVPAGGGAVFEVQDPDERACTRSSRHSLREAWISARSGC